MGVSLVTSCGLLGNKHWNWGCSQLSHRRSSGSGQEITRCYVFPLDDWNSVHVRDGMGYGDVCRHMAWLFCLQDGVSAGAGRGSIVSMSAHESHAAMESCGCCDGAATHYSTCRHSVSQQGISYRSRCEFSWWLLLLSGN